jgi:hypothetical protein
MLLEYINKYLTEEIIMSNTLVYSFMALFFTVILLIGCGSTDPDKKEQSFVTIKNDFNNATLERKPPWTIVKCSYREVEFGKILIGDNSEQKVVTPGFDYVLMVACWSDTSGTFYKCLPIASKVQEEVVNGQTRIIAINASNHWGPCPPSGTNIQPIDSVLYERIRAKWPEYGFEPYSSRTLNPQCLPAN